MKSPVQCFPNLFDHRSFLKVGLSYTPCIRVLETPSGKPWPSSFQCGGSCHLFLWIWWFWLIKIFNVFHIVLRVLYLTKFVVFSLSHSLTRNICFDVLLWVTDQMPENPGNWTWHNLGLFWWNLPEAIFLGRSRRKNTGFDIKGCGFKSQLNHLPAMWLRPNSFASPKFLHQRGGRKD